MNLFITEKYIIDINEISIVEEYYYSHGIEYKVSFKNNDQEIILEYQECKLLKEFITQYQEFLKWNF